MKINLAAILLVCILPLPMPAANRNSDQTHASNRIRAARAAVSMQDTPTPTPTATPTPDAALEQAKREAALADELKKKAVSDKDRAEAEAAKLKATVQPLGGSTVTVPTGSVQTDSAGFVESQMLAQEAARQIAGNLTLVLCRTPTSTAGSNLTINKLVIYNANDLTAVELYAAVIGQLERLKSELHDLNTGKPGSADALLQATDPNGGAGAAAAFGPIAATAAPAIATGVIKSVAELINLFRTDTSFQNKTIAISDEMVVSYIARNLMNNGFKIGDGALTACSLRPAIYFPQFMPPLLTQKADAGTSALIKLLNDIDAERIQAESNIVSIDARIKELNDLIGKVEKLKAKQKEQEQKKAELAALKKIRPRTKAVREKIKTAESQLKEIESALEKLKLTATEDANKDNFKDWIAKLTDLKTKIQSLITATNLITAKLNTPDDSGKLTALAQLLRAEKLHKILDDANAYTLRLTASANGTTKIKKNLFVDAKVRHSAGADLVYQLFNKDGAVVQGAVMHCYIDYRSAHDVRRIVSDGQMALAKCNVE